MCCNHFCSNTSLLPPPPAPRPSVYKPTQNPLGTYISPCRVLKYLRNEIADYLNDPQTFPSPPTPPLTPPHRLPHPTLIYTPTKVPFHISGLAGPTGQFLKGTHEFSELVLPRMALLIDQSRSVLPLRSVEARILESCGEENCMRALWTFPFIMARTSFLRPA